MITVSKVEEPEIRIEQRRLKILYLIDQFHGFGGTERHTFQLATRLDPKRFSCTICPMDFSMDFVEAVAASGVEVVPRHFERIYDLNGIRQMMRLSRFIKNGRFDIVQTFNISSDIVGTIAAKLAGVPIVISSRRDMGLYRKNRHLFVTKFLHRYVTHFIAVCNATAEQMVRAEGISRKRITTIYNGFDQTILKPVDPQNVEKIRRRHNLLPGDFVLGYVGHFRPEKGHRVLFESLKRLLPKIPRMKILTLGDGPTLPDIEQLVAQQDMSQQTIFAGYVDNVLDYVSLMDICCFAPISNEGFSNALLEQMSMAKPIVATDVGGNAEIIEHEVSGLIVPPNNVGALFEAMMHLYDHPETRKAMGENARLRALEKFSIRQMLSQTGTLYSQLFERHVGA